MAYDSTEALRAAGIIDDSTPPELTEAFRGLSQEETEVLISLKGRIPAALPEVVAHSAGGQWTKPEASQQGLEPAMMCMCGVWSGSGDAVSPAVN